MNLLESTRIANAITIQRLLRRYLSPPEGRSRTWLVEGATVYGAQIGNRYGVPSDSQTWRYVFEGQGGWTATVRACWHNGDLLRPWATHTVVISYVSDGGEDEACRSVNEWLQAVPL